MAEQKERLWGDGGYVDTKPEQKPEESPKQSSSWPLVIGLAVVLVGCGLIWKMWDSDQLKLRMEQHSAKYHHPYSRDCDIGSGCARKEINGGIDPYAK